MTGQPVQMVEAPEVAESGSRFASRKFIVTLLALAAATFMAWHAKLDAAQWVDVVKWVVGLYLTGNVGQAAVDAWKGRR